MAYIPPNSTIQLFENIPFDSDYHNTGFFATSLAMESYFSGKVSASLMLSEYSYQRENAGVIKVQKPFSAVYRVNYLRYQNQSHERKWFYAFVTKAEYISDTVTALHFSLDVMTTWFFQYTLENCFIERQHSATDGIGDNIVPESVDVGEQVYNNYDEMIIDQNNNFKDLYAVVCVCDVNAQAVTGTEQNNIYSGAIMYAFDVQDSTELSDMNSFMATYIQRPDSIVGLYMCPKCLCVRGGGAGQFANYFLRTAGNAPVYRYQYLPQLLDTATLNGYTPKNKKLFTYPYNYLVVDNAKGNALTLRYEFFGMNAGTYLRPSFTVDGCTLQPVVLRLRPSNYKGSGTITPLGGNAYGVPVNSDILTIDNYPLCSWNFDSYKAWIAQNAVPAGMNMLSSTISQGIQSAESGNANPLGMLNSVNSFLTSRYQASIAADQFRGTLNNGNVNVANDMASFFYGRMSCNYQTAKRIDDYFTMFGYAQGIVATPNRHARSRFTYIKTIGCEISGSIPNDDQLLIKAVFDAGVRFWANPDEIGDYITANAVLT